MTMQTAPARQGGSERGFTLIELLIVVAIIGILAAIAVGNMQSALDKSRQSKTMSNMRNMGAALLSYQNDNSMLPADSLTASQVADALAGSVFSRVNHRDGWDRDMVYSMEAGHFSLISWGSDGTSGPANASAATKTNMRNDLIYADGSFTASPES